MDLQSIPVSAIQPQRYGHRSTIDAVAQRSLVDSLASVGLINPILVTWADDHYRLVAGRCRLEAARELGWSEIQCIVRTEGEAIEATSAMAENLARNNLAPCEEGRLLKQALDAGGMTPEQLSRGIGRSVVWVRDRIRLLEWPVEFQAAADEGVLALSALGKLLTVADVDYRHTLLLTAIRNGATAQQVERWVVDWRMNQAPRGDDELVEIQRAPTLMETQVTCACVMCESMKTHTEGDWVFLCRNCGNELIHAKREVG